MQAFASGEICFSDEQVTQSTLLFEELKRSKKVTVKAEPINQEPYPSRPLQALEMSDLPLRVFKQTDPMRRTRTLN
jgi:hypothetical protein